MLNPSLHKGNTLPMIVLSMTLKYVMMSLQFVRFEECGVALYYVHISTQIRSVRNRVSSMDRIEQFTHLLYIEAVNCLQ